MLNLITKIGIYDPDADDYVILTNIMEGVDGSAAFSYEEEPGSVMIEDGQTLDHSITGTLDIKVLRASASDLAIIDAAVGKRVYISAMTINGFVLFHGTHYITRVPDFNSDILNDHIRLTFKRAKGYSGDTQSMGAYGGKNALMLYDVQNGYVDDNANEVFGGFFAFISSASYSVAGNELTMTSTAAGSGIVRLNLDNWIFWPFEEIITFSLNIVSTTGDIRLIMGSSQGPPGSTSASTDVEGPSSATGRRSVSSDSSYWNPSNRSLFYYPSFEFSGESTQVTAVVKDLAIKRGLDDTFSY